MTNRRSNGWADFVELDENPATERTVVEPMSFPDSTPTDPRTGATAAPQLPAMPEAPRALKMPAPSGGGRPAPARPITEDLDAPPLGAPSPGPRGRGDGGFSGEAFVDRLGAGAPAKPVAEGIRWREYRELIITGIIGVLLVSGAIGWRVLNPPIDDSARLEPIVERSGPRDEKRHGEEPAASPSPTDMVARGEVPSSPQPSAEPSVVGEATPTPTAPPSPVRAAVPMLSIITVPDGADLEIEGEVVGRSPLIVPAPVDARELRVVATKEGYEQAESSLVPNEGGHFNGTLILVPAPGGRPRR